MFIKLTEKDTNMTVLVNIKHVLHFIERYNGGALVQNKDSSLEVKESINKINELLKGL